MLIKSLLLAVAALAAASTSFALAACQVCHDPWDAFGRPEVTPPAMRAVITGLGCISATLLFAAICELAAGLAALV